MARNAERLKTEIPELLDSRIQLLTGDIGKANSVPYADYVIHAAATTDARSYLDQPEAEKRNIQGATYNYCRLAKSMHSRAKILYVSSGAVYGPQPPDLDNLNEAYLLDGLRGFVGGKLHYAIAKRDAESSIQELGGQGINVAIARCFAFVGSWLPRDQHFAIGNFIEDGFLGRPINVKSTIPVYRSYMHADDLIYWLMTICDSANLGCPIYNVGSDESISIGQLADLISKRFEVEVIKSELSQGAIDRYIPSINKAKNELGLKLSMDLTSAINKTVVDIRMRKLYA